MVPRSLLLPADIEGLHPYRRFAYPFQFGTHMVGTSNPALTYSQPQFLGTPQSLPSYLAVLTDFYPVRLLGIRS
jgi:hypothetical protein